MTEKHFYLNTSDDTEVVGGRRAAWSPVFRGHWGREVCLNPCILRSLREVRLIEALHSEVTEGVRADWSPVFWGHWGSEGWLKPCILRSLREGGLLEPLYSEVTEGGLLEALYWAPRYSHY